jgi:CRISPR/Cas system-associated exonuclease Cas4 (RecB family)
MIFLQEVAKKITENIQNWGDICIICPNKRTTDYLKFFLANEIKKTIWSPQFMNLSEFIQQFSQFKKVDDLLLLVELYKSFKKIMKDTDNYSNLDFERFYGIGEIILSDFNEIDNYLVDVEQIFRNITELEQIDLFDQILNEKQLNALKEFFGFYSVDNLTDEKQYFIQLWSKIPLIYNDFTNNLFQKKIAYNGLIAKNVNSKLDNNEILFNDFDKYIFVGFNALTKSQINLFKKIKKTGKALFFWDYDNFYINDDNQEAGLFLRKNLKLFGDNLDITRDNFLKPKNIKIIGFPLEIIQAKAIPTLLKELKIDLEDKKQLAKTAIVMPDEQLLFPVLHSLPYNIKQINVTVGFPFNNTAVFSFITLWFNTLQKLLTDNKIFYSDINKFFKNQVLKEILADKYDYINSKLEKANTVYFDINTLLALNNYILNILFDEQNLNSVEKLLDNLLAILEIIFKRLDKDKRTVETEAIYQFYIKLLDIQAIFSNELTDDKEIINVKILLKFLLKTLSAVHIPFSGKSIEGLQLMTLMETRNIDFENIVIINLNEQIIPHKISRKSLISEFMRKAFDLPLMIYQDSIFAYLFYRLIQNSKNIILSYSNLISEQSSEISRFVQQIMAETNHFSEKNHFQYKEQIKPIQTKNITIPKNDEIYKKILNFLDNEKLFFSASKLSTYISCPLKFYFSYIAKIPLPQKTELEYEIDPIRFGSIFHLSMEELYKPYIGQIITHKIIDKIKLNTEKTIKKSIISELNNNTQAVENGINIIIFDVIKKYILNTLDFDKTRSPFTLIGTEKKFYGKIFFQFEGKKHFISIFSIFDRLDKIDNTIHIIDYKTGKIEQNFKNIDSLFDTNTKYTLKPIFQLLLYSIITKQNLQNQKFIPELFDITKISKNYQPTIQYNNKIIDSYSIEVLDNFNTKLIELLNTILDKNINFEQTTNTANCQYCDFKNICGR